MVTTLWRTLIRVVSINEDTQQLCVVIPGWNPNHPIFINFEDIPASILRSARIGVIRFHALVNIGADQPDDLIFQDWEI